MMTFNYPSADAPGLSSRNHASTRSAQGDVGDAEGDRDRGDDQAVAGEGLEGDRVAVAFGDADDHHVGADGGGVAAEVVAQSERPTHGRLGW